MSLETLKRSNSLDKLLGAVEKENAPQEKKSYKDERLWKPELDKSGNGYAVIRFLPAVEGFSFFLGLGLIQDSGDTRNWIAIRIFI